MLASWNLYGTPNQAYMLWLFENLLNQSSMKAWHTIDKIQRGKAIKAPPEQKFEYIFSQELSAK